MRLLLDTHFLIWTMRDPAMLSLKEQATIAAADFRYVSSLSVWELRIKWNTIDRHGRRKGVIPPEFACDFLRAGDLVLREITAADFAALLERRPSHRDLFDEMLLVHAQQLGARLLTRDEKLLAHPLAYHPSPSARRR